MYLIVYVSIANTESIDTNDITMEGIYLSMYLYI
jgi:hypothetical protein